MLAAIAVCGQWPPTIGEIRNKASDAKKERQRKILLESDRRKMIGHVEDPAIIARGRQLLRECLDKIQRKAA